MEKYTDIECSTHGITRHRWDKRADRAARGRYNCIKCSTEAVIRQRVKNKKILINEAGGRCVRCDYDRCIAALEFHHRDPSQKEFALSGQGMARSLAKLRIEAVKCDLVCANCHREIEYPQSMC